MTMDKHAITQSVTTRSSNLLISSLEDTFGPNLNLKDNRYTAKSIRIRKRPLQRHPFCITETNQASKPYTRHTLAECPDT